MMAYPEAYRHAYKTTSVMFLITWWIIRTRNDIQTTITLLFFCHSSKCSERKEQNR